MDAVAMTPHYCWEQARKRFRDIEELEREIGIFDEAKRIREWMPLFPTAIFEKLPWDSPEARAADKADQEAMNEYVFRNIRRLYFDITDLNARRRLIGLWREVENFELLEMQAHISERRLELNNARKRRWRFAVAACVVAFFAIYSASRIGGVTALALGAALSVFAGWWAAEAERAERESFVSVAEDNLRAETEALEKRRTRRPLFSEVEAETGVADQPAR